MRLLKLPDNGKNMSRIALQLVEERFTVQVMTDTIEGLLKRAVELRHD